MSRVNTNGNIEKQNLHIFNQYATSWGDFRIVGKASIFSIYCNLHEKNPSTFDEVTPSYLYKLWELKAVEVKSALWMVLQFPQG